MLCNGDLKRMQEIKQGDVVGPFIIDRVIKMFRGRTGRYLARYEGTFQLGYLVVSRPKQFNLFRSLFHAVSFALPQYEGSCSFADQRYKLAFFDVKAYTKRRIMAKFLTLVLPVALVVHQLWMTYTWEEAVALVRRETGLQALEAGEAKLRQAAWWQPWRQQTADSLMKLIAVKKCQYKLMYAYENLKTDIGEAMIGELEKRDPQNGILRAYKPRIKQQNEAYRYYELARISYGQKDFRACLTNVNACLKLETRMKVAESLKLNAEEKMQKADKLLQDVKQQIEGKKLTTAEQLFKTVAAEDPCHEQLSDVKATLAHVLQQRDGLWKNALDDKHNKRWTHCQSNVLALVEVDSTHTNAVLLKDEIQETIRDCGLLANSIRQATEENDLSRTKAELSKLQEISPHEEDLKGLLNHYNGKCRQRDLLYEEAMRLMRESKWLACYEKIEEGGRVDVSDPRFKTLKDDVDKLSCSIIIVRSTIQGREVQGTLSINSKDGFSTACKIQREKGESLVCKVCYQEGVYAYEGSEKLTLDWFGQRTIAVELKCVDFKGNLAISDRVCLEMLKIPAGSFCMGSPENELERQSDEASFKVRITWPFWLGKHEVTQGQYSEIMGKSFSEDPSVPVADVKWMDAMAFCHKLTERERSAGRLPLGYVFSLPTEAQWEYACRAGVMKAYNRGEAIHSNDVKFANYGAPKNGARLPVGSYPPNAWGLFDMHGNVWEWCFDVSYNYPEKECVDYVAPESTVESAGNEMRVLRGGAWSSWKESSCRSANRDKAVAGSSGVSQSVGFRLALIPKKLMEK